MTHACRLFAIIFLFLLRSFCGLNFSDDKQESEESEAGKCVELLRLACARHQFLLRHAITGKGVDRHLLTLNMATQLRTYMVCFTLILYMTDTQAIKNMKAKGPDLTTQKKIEERAFK